MWVSNAAKRKMSASRRSVIVVGGGAAGCASALALAKNGWKVSSYEKNTLFSGTSSTTSGRLGLGFHYTDLETSAMLLRAAIRLVKTFPGFRVGENLPRSHPLRHGRYFVTKNSVVSPEKILVCYESLKQVYADIVKEDPSSMVFGRPEDFYRILKPIEYENEVDTSQVVLGIETSEHLLDWGKLQRYLEVCIRKNEHISIHENTELVNAKPLQDDAQSRFMLDFICGQEKKTVNCDYMVNSTWYEIEKFNNIAGFSKHPLPCTNRLKALLHVRLPISMYDSHSMFFCFGPFCKFSNLGDGTGLLTYAPVTNITNSSDVSISEKMYRLLEQGPSEKEFHSISQGIHRGTMAFIPEIANAKILGLRFGIVQTLGTVDLSDPNSPVHKRAYFGVGSETAGWISNPCMKLIYLLENGDIVTNILEETFNENLGDTL